MRKLRTRLRILFIVLMLLVGHPHQEGWLAGWPLIVLGVLLHLWASGTLSKNRVLTMSGPYRFVRNPFYVGDFLRDAGVLLCCNFGFDGHAMAGWIVAAAYFAVRYGLVIRRRVLYKEEPELRSLFGERYEAYCRQVPRFLPRPWPAGDAGWGGFRWANLARHRELPRTLADLLLVGALYFRWEFIHYRFHLARAVDDMWEMFAVTAIISLFLVNLLPVERWVEGAGRRALRWLRAVPMAITALLVAAMFLCELYEYENDLVIWTVGLGLCVPALAMRMGWGGRNATVPAPPAWAWVDALFLAGLAFLAELVWLMPFALLLGYEYYRLERACASAGALSPSSGERWPTRLGRLVWHGRPNRAFPRESSLLAAAYVLTFLLKELAGS